MSSESIFSVVSKLRASAKTMRDSKTKVAEKLLKGLDDARPMIRMYTAGMKSVVAVYSAAGTSLDAIMSNDSLKATMTTFVGNVVSDVASRINEAANVLEAISTDGKVDEAFKKCREELEVLASEFNDVKARKRSHLSVVDDPADAASSAVPPATTEEPPTT